MGKYSKMKMIDKPAADQLQDVFSNIKISIKDNTRVGNLNVYPDKITFHDRIHGANFEVKITKIK